MIIIGTTIVLVATCSVACFIGDYYLQRRKGDFELKFSEFKRYYEANPSRYECIDYPKSVLAMEYIISFSFLDYAAFRWWRYKILKDKQHSVATRNKERYLRVAQEDVKRR